MSLVRLLSPRLSFPTGDPSERTSPLPDNHCTVVAQLLQATARDGQGDIQTFCNLRCGPWLREGFQDAVAHHSAPLAVYHELETHTLAAGDDTRQPQSVQDGLDRIPRLTEADGKIG